MLLLIGRVTLSLFNRNSLTTCGSLQVGRHRAFSPCQRGGENVRDNLLGDFGAVFGGGERPKLHLKDLKPSEIKASLPVEGRKPLIEKSATELQI